MSAAVCAACRHENREGARFCEECGSPIARRCPSCGSEVGSKARFCDQCGTAIGPAAAPGASREAIADRLAPKIAGYTPRHLAERILTSRAALVGERKQVTVLFADVAGFTDLSTRLDPEDLHGIMDGCFERLIQVVHRYEGSVNQFTGDGVMALFGAPIAHEDHAARAVAAALAAQRALADYAGDLRRERGLEFAMRIGLNTGPVVVGRIGDDLRMDYTAQGETVNLAARLQSTAPVGGVLVGESTHRLIAGRFRTEPAGTLTLKGFPRPVAAHRVLSERSRLLRFDLARERGLTPLVGRDRERVRLRELTEDACNGRGVVVSIVGEAGIGKSRLVHELVRDAGEGMRTARASCPAHRAAAPFHLATQLLTATFGFEESDEATERHRKLESSLAGLGEAAGWVTAYARHLVGLPAPELEREGLDVRQRKQRTLEALKAIVFANARLRPLILVVEDLQWIDQSSEEMLASLVDGLASQPLLLVATYRTGYTPSWEGRTLHHRIGLGPLDPDDARRIVTHRLGGASDDLSARLLERAGGNPFFLEELAEFARDPEGRSADGAAVVELPATVQGVVAARIDRLPEALKATLQVAAVLGRELTLGLLEETSDAAGEVRAHVSELVRLEILEERELVPEIRVGFTNPLLQEVAYESLLVKARTQLHGRAGEALERRGAGGDEALRELARHFARSGRGDKAIDYLERAADRANELFAFLEAEQLYAQAMQLLAPSADDRRRELTGKMGDSAWARGALREAITHWERALSLAPDARHSAGLHARIGAACWAAAERERALEHLHRGLEALGNEGENPEAARLHQELGRIYFRLGDHPSAIEAAERALRLGETLDAADVVSHACNTIGLAVARSGDLERGIEWVRRSLDAALASGFSCAACRAYTNLAVLTGSIDHSRSIAYAREGLALARRIGDQLQEAWLSCALASGHCSIDGDYDEGLKAARAAIDLDERLGQRGHLPIPLILLAQIHQCRGENRESRAYYERALEMAETVGEPQLLFPCFDGLATLAIENDDEAEAERWLERSRALESETGWSSDVSLLIPFVS